ncbi:unnamed protein product [Clavelina lepadiformis]|uniref:Hydantoinase B/oxoprolinase domain-containing protein n=1 Tax=Clavelina lepadiformis TaxID=159417 RepID=A0ABP0G9C2_CLALP
MQDTVQYQMRTLKINEGDCILSNHPYAGRVHLPDFTGIHLILELISNYGLKVVQAYMAHIQHHAEVAVRNLLRDVSMTTDGVLRASDKMNDGSVINLHVEIDSQESSATFDFEGTSPMVINKLNAPAVAKSKEIY